jgi:hypothetical protein
VEEDPAMAKVWSLPEVLAREPGLKEFVAAPAGARVGRKDSSSPFVMSATEDWEQLHDALLESVRLSWEEGTATLSLTLPSPPSRRAEVVVRDLAAAFCPREQPWGRSIYVNKVALERAVSGGVSTLKIEMQSGDVLEFRGSSIELHRHAN